MDSTGIELATPRLRQHQPAASCPAHSFHATEVVQKNTISLVWPRLLVLGLVLKFLLERLADFYDRKSSGLELSWTSVSSSGSLMWDVCSSGNVGTTPVYVVHQNFQKWIKLANSAILPIQIDNKTCVIWRPAKFYGTQLGNIILKDTRTLSWRLERSLCCHNHAFGDFGRAFARSSQH